MIISFTIYAGPAFTLAAKVDIKAEIKPANNNPFKPTGIKFCKAKGKSSIIESIFENRFMHVAELRRLGAEIVIKKNKAFILGNTNFQAAELMSSDLRASVALVLAAIVAKGSTTINRIYHLDRGYENIENKLRKVGVNIRRIN